MSLMVFLYTSSRYFHHSRSLSNLSKQFCSSLSPLSPFLSICLLNSSSNRLFSLFRFEMVEVYCCSFSSNTYYRSLISYLCRLNAASKLRWLSWSSDSFPLSLASSSILSENFLSRSMHFSLMPSNCCNLTTSVFNAYSSMFRASFCSSSLSRLPSSHNSNSLNLSTRIF